MTVDNRVVIVTGATGALGRVVTRQFAERGARLVLLGRNAERLAQLARELDLAADRYLAHAVDLADPAATHAAVAAAIERFGRVEVLLHLVGGWSGGQAVPDVPIGEIDSMLRQHLWTTLHLAQALVPHLTANGWGRIIVVSSPVASGPRAKFAPYAVGKSAQEALLLTLSEELKRSGVTTNILLVRAIDVQHERDREPTAKNAAWTTPEEIAAAMLYLCSNEAGTVNGARIPLYGSAWPA